ncbi:MAG: flagellar hook-basal body complex protein FliE [Rhodanobacter sp.]
MSVTPIEGVSIARLNMPERGVSEVPQGGPSFLQMAGAALDQVNGSLNAADASARALAAGENIPVQDVMIAMENAHLQLQFAVEVRNRVVDAYQNLTNMQL